MLCKETSCVLSSSDIHLHHCLSTYLRIYTHIYILSSVTNTTTQGWLVTARLSRFCGFSYQSSKYSRDGSRLLWRRWGRSGVGRSGDSNGWRKMEIWKEQYSSHLLSDPYTADSWQLLCSRVKARPSAVSWQSEGMQIRRGGGSGAASSHPESWVSISGYLDILITVTRDTDERNVRTLLV